MPEPVKGQEPVEGQERDHNEDADVDVDEGTSMVGSIDQSLTTMTNFGK